MKRIIYSLLLITTISDLLSAALALEQENLSSTMVDSEKIHPGKNVTTPKQQFSNPSTILDHDSQSSSPLRTTLQANKLHRYFMASYYQAGNKIEKAHTWYNRLVNDAMPPYAYKGYISFLHTLGHSNHIYTLMPKVDTLLPNDPDTQLIFAQVLEQTGKEKESHERIINLSHKFPLNEEICYAATQIFLKRNEPKNAIAAIDTLVNTAPRKQNTFIFHYSKAIALLSLENRALALESVKKSLELQPHFDRGWLLYSLIEEQLGNTQEALRGYATYLNIASKKGLIELHVQHLKEHKPNTQDAFLKNEQKTILDMAIHRHVSNKNTSFLKELLTRFALLDSTPSFQP